jgi:hypothetical protein
MEILCDFKVEKMLNSLISSFDTTSHHEGSLTLENLLSVIEKWWKKITENSIKAITAEQASAFLMQTNAVDSSNDALRFFAKFCQKLSFQQFSSIFSKSLFKFLMSQLIVVLEKKELKCMSPDIAINAQRRKMILDSLKLNDSSTQNLKINKLYNVY